MPLISLPLSRPLPNNLFTGLTVRSSGVLVQRLAEINFDMPIGKTVDKGSSGADQ